MAAAVEAGRAGPAVQAGPVRQAALREEPGAGLELVSARPQVLRAVPRAALREVQAVRRAESELAAVRMFPSQAVSCRTSTRAR
jgi:hypothetical protein